MKVEVAVGRRRTWYGKREPERHQLVRLMATVPRSAQPARVRALADWVRRLRRAHPDEAQGPLAVHRSSDPNHWIVAWPWSLADRANAIAETALALVERDVPARVSERLTPRQFTIRNFAARLAAVGDLWEPVLSDRQRLEAPFAALEALLG